MTSIGWLVRANELEKVEIVEETSTSRRLRVLEGDREGREVVIGPEGLPNGRFNPALYVGEEKPELFRFKGRSLRVRSPEEYENSEQAEALVPDITPYTFQPWTEQVVDAIQRQVLALVEERAHLAGLGESLARGLVRGGEEIPPAGLGTTRGRGPARQPLRQPGPLEPLQGSLVATKAHQGGL